jgi:phage terminase large subunit-like protein
VEIARTRLAQSVVQEIKGYPPKPLKLKMYYDCNPPNKGHWTYKQFIKKIDPESGKPISNPEAYAAMRINPMDNAANLPPAYLVALQNMSAKMKLRFFDGKFADANPNAYFCEDNFETWRIVDASELPDMVRVVVAVDPSGSDDVDNATNDAIGIAVVGLGVDGRAYVLEDCTVKAGPGTWGKVATNAYDRHGADLIIGEGNFGGAMVKFVVQAAKPRVPFKLVTASRGKVVRAAPISVLYDDGKVSHVGELYDMEEEMCGFSKVGYIGEKSPNRADAVIWGLTELFYGIINKAGREKSSTVEILPTVNHWG